MLPCFVAFVVQVPVFFLQVELDPVVKSNDFCSRFCLSNKDMLKSTGVQAVECFRVEIPYNVYFFSFAIVNSLFASKQV